MRVALLSPVFWPEVRRGTERVARDLAEGLRAAGDHPRIITSHPGRGGLAVEDGVEVQRVPRPPGGARLERRMYEQHLTHVPLTRLALGRFAPDLAHAFFAPDALAATSWGRRTGRPVVYAFMGVPHRQGLANRRLRKELVVRACHESDAVVALSEEAAEAFEHWLGVTARPIPPGVDLERFTPDPAARAAAPTILCAADPGEPRKRVGLLAEAVALLRPRHPGLRLVLDRRGGRGPAGARRGGGGHVARPRRPGRARRRQPRGLGRTRCRASARRSGSSWPRPWPAGPRWSGRPAR